MDGEIEFTGRRARVEDWMEESRLGSLETELVSTQLELRNYTSSFKTNLFAPGQLSPVCLSTSTFRIYRRSSDHFREKLSPTHKFH